jgi:SAM-dependent methyltransferase
MNAPYDKPFFEGLQAGSATSARYVVPEILKVFNIESVLDVGCGSGAWLREFGQNGVKTYLGIDGDYVDRQQLLIPPEYFRAVNLEKTFDVGRFDLVCSLEVAEHLPLSSADGFVESLTRAAPVVVFSAAIPYQGGLHHINEQWQSYWATKFAGRGYIALDFIRPTIRHNEEIRVWYRQNILVYCEPEMCPENIRPITIKDTDLVLPELYQSKLDEKNRLPTGAESIKGLIGAVKRRVTKILAMPH